jgi:hypothetical protein
MLSFTRASVACFCKGPVKTSQQNIGARRRATREKHLSTVYGQPIRTSSHPRFERRFQWQSPLPPIRQ